LSKFEGILTSAPAQRAGGLIRDWAQSDDPVFGFALASVLVGMTPFPVAPAWGPRRGP
jgi:hypothetical protein